MLNSLGKLAHISLQLVHIIHRISQVSAARELCGISTDTVCRKSIVFSNMEFMFVKSKYFYKELIMQIANEKASTYK